MTLSLAQSVPSTIEILEQYIDAGFGVIPIWGIKDKHCACPLGAKCDKGPGKHPNQKLAPNGAKNAARDKALVAVWARAFPNGNWALRSGEALTGGGYAVVVDVDPRNGGDLSLAQILGEYGEMEASPSQDTGGNGNHFLFQSEKPCSSRAPAPGIEIIADGKYFLVAPSRHMSGGEYTWSIGKSLGEVEIAAAPTWVLDYALSSPRPARDGESARDTVLGEAFALAGMLGAPMVDGTIAVKCPWADEHSDQRGRGEDSSTVILPPAGGSRFGGFSCKHSHCASRKWQDVVQKLPAAAVDAGRRKYPMKVVDHEPPALPATSTAPADPETALRKEIEACKLALQYKLTKSGWVIKHDIINLITILHYDPRWRGILKYDHFAQNIRFMREPSWHPDDCPDVPFETWSEGSINCLDAWLRREWALELGAEKIMQSVSIVANRNSIHPLRTYLDSLEWDGVKRVDTWLPRYLGTEDNQYTRAVGAKWLISAVARAYKPGCKADHVLILEGPQGRGKSTALSVLTSPLWFTDTPIDIGSKDAYLNLRGKWIVELAELASLNKADVERAKAFFSSPIDTYRPPYGRIPADFPRQCIFAGTVNLDQYFQDDTGNRRFWPVACGIIDLDSLAEDRDQIWAETISKYANGEIWWPAYEEREIFEQEQSMRVIPDLWTDTIAKWLGNKSVLDFIKKNGHLTANDILERALNIDPAEHDRGKMQRLGSAMKQLGWVKIRLRDQRHRPYAYKPSSIATAA